jgi:hypothetical protein
MALAGALEHKHKLPSEAMVVLWGKIGVKKDPVWSRMKV